MRVLHLDLETYSDIDIRKYGMHRYIDSPNFEIMLLAYAFDDEPVQIIDFMAEEQLPFEVVVALESDEVLKMAHNAPFEINCLRKYYFDLEESQWRCTAVHSAQLGLPRSLSEVCKQLKLGEDKAKMATGKALINYFCKPCKPTKVNGKRTRNYPEHDPIKWEEFKKYCMMDVEAEREVDRKLSAFPVPQEEWDLWEVDQRINNRGALVDMDFVNHVLGIWEEGKEKLMEEAKLLTGLDNPNSRDQLKGWLGLGADETLQKADVKELIKGSECDLTTRVLEIRQELSKTSINKYTALGEATCSDGRIKGTLLFYGASRTGRWAGRVFQPQNLPQNHLDDLDAERHLVKTQDYDTLEMLYGSVADLLSQLIRTSIIAPPGKKLIVVDYSAVEARGIAWLADEKWRLDVFTGHGKIYEASAAAAFKVPIESIDKGSPLRQQGKVLELACTAEGSLVLTHCGLKPIEKVSIDDRVWDGVEWVRHEGVIFKGYKEVISYGGLEATEDHLVWTQERGPTEFGRVKDEKLTLVRSGVGGSAVWVGEDNKPRKGKVSPQREGINEMQRVWCGEMGISAPPNVGEIKGVSEMFSTTTGVRQGGEGDVCCSTEVSEPKRQILPELWRAWYRIQLRIHHGRFFVDRRALGGWGSWFTDRQNRKRGPLRTWESEVGDPKRKHEQHSGFQGKRWFSTGRMALLRENSKKLLGFWFEQGSDYREGKTISEEPGEELEANREKVRVYDILNAGPRHRFTCSDILVHNCGYGGSVGAIDAMDTKKAIPEADRKSMVDAWRAASPRIVQMWWSMGSAAMEALETPGLKIKVEGNAGKLGVYFKFEKGILFMGLPSGRRLAYPRAKIEYGGGKFGQDQIVFEGLDQVKNTWCKIDTYGPKLVENLVQAMCRDLLGYGIMQLEKEGYPVVLHVHDEAVVEVDLDVKVETIEEIFARKPQWAATMPHKGDGFETLVYRKD